MRTPSLLVGLLLVTLQCWLGPPPALPLRPIAPSLSSQSLVEQAQARVEGKDFTLGPEPEVHCMFDDHCAFLHLSLDAVDPAFTRKFGKAYEGANANCCR